MTRTIINSIVIALIGSFHLPMNAEIQSFFGTDGIRKTMGVYPLTFNDLPIVGFSIALWAQEKYAKKNPSILIASDTRQSADFLKSCLNSGLLLTSVTVYDAGILPTPVAHYLLKTGHYDCALILTASHNHHGDNGIKIIDTHTSKLTREDENTITALMHTAKPAPDYRQLGTLIHLEDPSAYYCKALATHFAPDFLQDTTIVLDCAHGATSTLAPKIFKAFGAQVITINNEPTGTNINLECGATDTRQLERAVLLHHADAGFAFDGDGDRLIVVNRLGQCKDGDDILYLFSQHPSYKRVTTLVSSIMANQGLENKLSNDGKSLLRTPVGDKHICQALKQHDLCIGAEPSGHGILTDHLESSDGIYSALRVMESVLSNKNYDMETFIKMPNILINIPVPYKKDLTCPEVASIINLYQQQLASGRLLVRYSGTENLLRIMVEDTEYDHAQVVAQQLSKELAHIIM